jgi:hypothetical protein
MVITYNLHSSVPLLHAFSAVSFSSDVNSQLFKEKYLLTKLGNYKSITFGDYLYGEPGKEEKQALPFFVCVLRDSVKKERR